VIRWPGAAEAEERGWYRREPVDANRVATGQRTLKRAKQVCASTGFTEAKIWHFLGSAARQRLLAIASAFDLNGAQIGKSSSSTSLVRKRSIRSNQVPRPAMLPVAVGDRRFGVLVRIQYAAALNRRLSLGVVPYSECVGRSHRYRTRLTVRSRPTYASFEYEKSPRRLDRGLSSTQLG
jgi:hypothetical protein